MGNCCSVASSSPSDPFSQPGRTVSSAPPPNAAPKSSVPLPRKVGGPAQKLGSSSASSAQTDEQQADARRKAAEAAELRAKSASKTKGKLGAQLQEQKKQTRVDTLEGVSRDELRARAADEGAAARAYN